MRPVLPENLQLENPLWDYALSVYPRLNTSLIALQSHGARVNQLLAALWCSATDRQWPSAVSPEIEHWHQQQVLPIRQRRMALKPELETYPQLRPLYEAYKSAEVNLERVELAMLWAWLQSAAPHLPTSAEVNIDAVLSDNSVDLSLPERAQLIKQVNSL